VAIVSAVPKTRRNVNKRYQYGELRLPRLNKILWARSVLRGYRFPYQTYGEMFTANIAPIAAATIYISLVLAAMQVGLATDQLGNSAVYHTIAYGSTMLAIFDPMGSLGIVCVVVIIHFIFSAMFTCAFRRKKRNGGLVLPISEQPTHAAA
jgi:hypothetical protein